MGIDVVGAYDIRRLPDCALVELADMITSWETHCALAWQVLGNLVSLIPKPNGDERCIGLVAWLVRFACALRGHLVQEWAAAGAGFWDDALRACSALRAAALRAFASSILACAAVVSRRVWFGAARRLGFHIDVHLLMRIGCRGEGACRTQRRVPTED